MFLWYGVIFYLRRLCGHFQAFAVLQSLRYLGKCYRCIIVFFDNFLNIIKRNFKKLKIVFLLYHLLVAFNRLFKFNLKVICRLFHKICILFFCAIWTIF
nr:MAG TPA: hypothetical protein [Caudoviricetes sp.]